MRMAVTTALMTGLLAQGLSGEDFDCAKQSAIVVRLKHNPPGKDTSRTMDLRVKEKNAWLPGVGDGHVYEIKARPGSTVKFQITGINTKKYAVVSNYEEPDPPKLALPTVIAKAFDGLIPGLTPQNGKGVG